jgi:hypothetical protein
MMSQARGDTSFSGGCTLEMSRVGTNHLWFILWWTVRWGDDGTRSITASDVSRNAFRGGAAIA